ncbi:MFS transporter [Streptomyces sp. HB132]|uniref:MFS transporter n=1 Tax=Streptomyces sp. HB132 TaxID=767388 RepID=UPI00195F26A7|nr:MFS transporter [Streptomyces sp. HB132]MBM7443038.1 MFS family permease [Streptomyces sp. HB132]
MGTGLWLPVSILYFVNEAGLPPGQVALGMSIAGIIGLFGSVLSSWPIKRWGPRRMLILFSASQAALTLTYATVDSFAEYLPVAIASMFAARSGRVCRNVLIGTLTESEQRIRVRALTRGAGNTGVAMGTATAGLLLQSQADSAYLILLCGNALSFFATTMAAWGVQRDTRGQFVQSRTEARKTRVIGDRPFLFITLITTVLGVHDAILVIALPLWITSNTEASEALMAVLLLINTVMCVTLQLRASRDTESLTGGARVLRWSGLTIGISCLVYWSSMLGGPVAAVVLLLVAVTIHTCGELWFQAGSWGIFYSLAPPKRLPDYQAIFSLVNVGSDVLGPVAVTMLITGWGPPGWGVLSAVFIAAAITYPPLARWAEKVRVDSPTPTEDGENEDRCRAGRVASEGRP